MKRKCLITGATGFVGSNLARKLVNTDWDVTIVCRKDSSLENIEDILSEVKVYRYENQIEDLIKFFKENDFEVVYHLASLFIAEHKNEDIRNLIESNILFGTEILEAMKESNTKLLINTGTSWQHYNSEEYNPVDLYAATKEAYEKIIKYYVEAANIRCVTLKLFDTYGENDKRPKLINLLNKFADEKKVLDMSLGEQKLDLVHVDKVTDSFIKAFELLKNKTDLKYDSYGVSSGKQISLREIVENFERENGKKVLINWGARPYRKREVMEPIKSLKNIIELTDRQTYIKG